MTPHDEQMSVEEAEEIKASTTLLPSQSNYPRERYFKAIGYLERDSQLQPLLKKAVEALKEIANADHQEDGGPECNHPDLAEETLSELSKAGVEVGEEKA